MSLRVGPDWNSALSRKPAALYQASAYAIPAPPALDPCAHMPPEVQSGPAYWPPFRTQLRKVAGRQAAVRTFVAVPLLESVNSQSMPSRSCPAPTPLGLLDIPPLRNAKFRRASWRRRSPCLLRHRRIGLSCRSFRLDSQLHRRIAGHHPRSSQRALLRCKSCRCQSRGFYNSVHFVSTRLQGTSAPQTVAHQQKQEGLPLRQQGHKSSDHRPPTDLSGNLS